MGPRKHTRRGTRQPPQAVAPDVLRDPVRLAHLRALDLLDSPAEEAFDRLTRLTARLLKAPVALISLVDENRQYFKSCIGLGKPWCDLRETPLSHSICQYVVVTGEPLVISDARRNPLVRHNLAIPDLGVVAYAGIPLRTHDGHVLGTLCVIDHKPRRWTKAEIGLLEHLATCVLSSIELRAVALSARRAEVRLREEEHRVRHILSQVPATVWTTDRDLRLTRSLGAGLGALNLAPDQVVGMSLYEHMGTNATAIAAHRDALAGEAIGHEIEWQGRHFYYRVVPLRDLQGAISGVVGVAEDITDRRLATVASQANRERFELVARATNDVVWDWDLQTDALWWNENFETAFGHPRDGAVDITSWTSHLHPDDLDRVVHGIHAVIDQGGSAWTDDYRFRRADGSYADIYDRGFVLRDSRGAPTRMLGAMMDMTERRRAETALRTSEATLRGVIDASLDSVIVVNDTGIITGWNAQAERTFGWTAGEAVGRPIEETIIPPVDRGLHRHGFDRFIATGEARILGQRIFRDARRRDGSLVPVELGIVPLRIDGHWVFSAFVRDLSESRRVEAEQRRLLAILEGTTDYVGSATAEGRMLYLNRAGRRLVGIAEQEDVVGRPVSDFRPAWASELILREGLPAAIRDGAWVGETALLARDGREIPVSQVILAHKGADGSVEFLSTVARDITALQLLQRQLAESQKMEAIGRLAGGIAHDFNNVLTAISGYTDLLIATVDADDPRRQDLAEIRRGADRASDLTHQLLAFSRRQVLQPRPLDLNATVDELVRMLERLIGEHIQLVIERDPDLGAVLADDSQIGQVILNLAINARDAMPSGGRLTLSTRNVELDADGGRAWGLPPGRFAALEVADSGTGMDENTMARIFEPFFTTKQSGTGLGLATVYGIVQQSGGAIRVDSARGRGTSFVVLLPRVDARPEMRAPEMPRDPAASASGTILLVEDEAAVRALLSRVLIRHGYTVLEASDGAQGLVLAEEHRGHIDLLLTDMVMPQLSGRQVAERVRLLDGRIQIVLMSGYSEEDALNQGAVSAGTLFLQKPFTIATLLETVQRAGELAARTDG